MRPGRPLRPALAGWRLGVAALPVIVIPIVVAALLLTEFDLLQDDGDEPALSVAESTDSSTTPVSGEPDDSLSSPGVVETPADEPATDEPAEQSEALAEAQADADLPVYIVVPGDTLASIARRFERDVFAVAAYNGLADINRLNVGQELRIPPADFTAPEPEPEEDAATEDAGLTPAGTTPTQ